MRKVRDRDIAADLAQESYARVLAMQQTGEAIREPGALLRQVALNTRIDWERRASIRQHDDIHALLEADQPRGPQALRLKPCKPTSTLSKPCRPGAAKPFSCICSKISPIRRLLTVWACRSAWWIVTSSAVNSLAWLAGRSSIVTIEYMLSVANISCGGVVLPLIVRLYQ